MKQNTIADYKVKNKKKMAHWSPLMEEWLLLIERFSRVSSDASYLYNERANVSLLAGAAWRCGRVALEEFSHEKIHEEDSEISDGTAKLKAKATKSGRCDLWMMGQDDKDEIVEAKINWLSLDNHKIPEVASKYLSNACKDATKTMAARDIEGTKGIGVLFLPVYLKVSKVENDSSKSIESFIDNAVENIIKVDADLISWSFPRGTRNLKGSDERNYLPGIFLIAKVI